MELHLQNFLRNGGTLDQLEEGWAISATRSVRYPNLVLFKYDQIESPPAAPIVVEARGIILDEANDWAVVARSFDRFFNVGDPHATEVDWDNCRVQEKLDGSLIQMYWYDNQWLVATSGNPDAAGNVNGFDMTFETLFWDTFRATIPSVYEKAEFDPKLTYVWELTSPYNKVVVQHTEAKVTLIGLRDVATGAELPVYPISPFVPVVRSFPLKSLSEVLAACKELKGFEQEGFVVVDSNFNRVKVKSPHYVMLHHTRDSMSPKGFVDVIRNGESDEFLAYFPEFTELFNTIKLKYQFFVAGCDADWYTVVDKVFPDKEVAPGLNFKTFDIALAQYNNGAMRKKFAAEATKMRLPGYLFARLDGKVANCAEYLKNQPLDNVMRLLELK